MLAIAKSEDGCDQGNMSNKKSNLHEEQAAQPLLAI